MPAGAPSRQISPAAADPVEATGSAGDGEVNRPAQHRATSAETAAIVAGLTRYLAKIRADSLDEPAAGLIADLVASQLTALIEDAAGAVNERGEHYGEQALLSERKKVLIQADRVYRANAETPSAREFREAFKSYQDGDWKRDRVNPDPPKYTEKDPGFFFYQALSLIDDVPAVSTLYAILRPNPIRR